MTATIISLILAIFKAFPILDKWFEQFKEAKEIEAKKRNRESVEESAQTGDQRPIEDAMNSSKTGKPSGIPGSEIKDKLPGVE